MKVKAIHHHHHHHVACPELDKPHDDDDDDVAVRSWRTSERLVAAFA